MQMTIFSLPSWRTKKDIWQRDHGNLIKNDKSLTNILLEISKTSVIMEIVVAMLN